MPVEQRDGLGAHQHRQPARAEPRPERRQQRRGEHHVAEKARLGDEHRRSRLRPHKYKIGASLACADQLNLGSEIKSLIDCGIDFLHIDVMDGIFVNNYCFGTNIFDYLKQFKDIEIETHMMVTDPYNKLSFFENKHIHKLSFHIEASNNPIQTLIKIKKFGMKCGIAINAATSEKMIDYLYDSIDYILVMTVEAGFTGQAFVSSVIEKIKIIKKELDRRNMDKDIYVDGHIDAKTISLLNKAGANAFVGGSTGLFMKGKYFFRKLQKIKKSIVLMSKLNLILSLDVILNFLNIFLYWDNI